MAVPTSSASGSTATGDGKKYTYRELQDLVTGWTQELGENEKMFQKHAHQIYDWDKTLTVNAEKIVELHDNLDAVQADHNRMEKEIDMIIAQQKELEELLVPLEGEVNSRQLRHGQTTDSERERIFGLVGAIDQQMTLISEDLNSIIEHINGIAATSDMNNPVVQMSRILNAHAESLQWIERQTGALARQLEHS